MINQKGQAFSVFELMIAGVVAFAILMLLLQILPKDVTPNNDPLTSISTAINSVQPSGEGKTSPFVLNTGTSIAVEDIASKTSMDKGSFIFTMGAFTSEDKIETDGTYLRYVGAQKEKTIAAMIICKETNQSLLDSLSRLDSKYDTTSASEGCPEDGLVCCVIIPVKQ
jgi:hypothetical protein